MLPVPGDGAEPNGHPRWNRFVTNRSTKCDGGRRRRHGEVVEIGSRGAEVTRDLVVAAGGEDMAAVPLEANNRGNAEHGTRREGDGRLERRGDQEISQWPPSERCPSTA